MNLAGDTFTVNQCCMSKRHDTSVFYGGERCRQYSVKRNCQTVEDGSFNVSTYYRRYIYTSYRKDSLNKESLQRAIAISTRALRILMRYRNLVKKLDITTMF